MKSEWIYLNLVSSPMTFVSFRFDDYLEMVVQFGYIVLFAGAFPAGAAFAIFSEPIFTKLPSN